MTSLSKQLSENDDPVLSRDMQEYRVKFRRDLKPLRVQGKVSQTQNQGKFFNI